MATTAQIQANRLNAQKSTGPRTAEGKERASQNAVKHGLLAREAVIQGEDPAEFEIYREGMIQDAGPGRGGGDDAGRAGGRALVAAATGRAAPEHRLRCAGRWGADRRCWRPGSKSGSSSRAASGIGASAGVIDEDAALGKAVVEDFAGARVLDRLQMYERRIESSLYRTMAELRKEREARRMRVAAEPEEIPHSEGNLAAGQESATAAKLASFGAEPVPAEGQTSGDGSDFTPQTSHFKLEEKITPCGVTTNEEGRATESGAETLHASPFTLHDRSCETNPIPDGRPK